MPLLAHAILADLFMPLRATPRRPYDHNPPNAFPDDTQATAQSFFFTVGLVITITLPESSTRNLHLTHSSHFVSAVGFDDRLQHMVIKIYS